MPSLQIPFVVDTTTGATPLAIALRGLLETLTPAAAGRGSAPIQVAVSAYRLTYPRAGEANEADPSLGGIPLLRMTAAGGARRSTTVPLAAPRGGGETTNLLGGAAPSLRVSTTADVAAFLSGSLNLVFDPWTLPPAATSISTLVAPAGEPFNDVRLAAWAAALGGPCGNGFVSPARETIFVDAQSTPNRVGAVIGSRMHAVLRAGGFVDANDPPVAGWLGVGAYGMHGLVITTTSASPTDLTSLAGAAHTTSPDTRLNLRSVSAAAIALRFNPTADTGNRVFDTVVGPIELWGVAAAVRVRDNAELDPNACLGDLATALRAGRRPYALAPRRAATGCSGLLTVHVG